MTDLLNWLLAHSVIATIVTIVASVAIISITAILLIGFLQGRSVSLWPLQIGTKTPQTDKIANNILDEQGFRNLLEIYYYSSAFHVNQIIEEALDGMVNLDGDDVFELIRNRLLQNRNRLQVFSAILKSGKKINSIPEYIKRTLPDNRIREIIERDAKPILQDTSIDEKKKRVRLRHIVEKGQSDLLAQALMLNKLDLGEY